MSGLTSKPITPPSSAPSSVGHDQVLINFPANSYTQLVNEARSMPEVRPDVVSSYQNKVQSLMYPPPDIINGLTELIGGALFTPPSQTSSSSATIPTSSPAEQ